MSLFPAWLTNQGADLTMKAVWYERNGPAEVMQVGEMPEPEPGPGEVRIKMASSGVNPSDWKRRLGMNATLPSLG